LILLPKQDRGYSIGGNRKNAGTGFRERTSEESQGRSQREIRVYDLLDSLGIGYERIDHERADTMEACLAVDEAIHANICKNLFLCNRQQTEFYLLMMPGEKKFKTKELSHQIGSARLSFAGEEFLENTWIFIRVQFRSWD
jgi:hypothetical protein